jgi:hypothetical protein
MTNPRSRPECPSWCVADHSRAGYRHQGPRDAIVGFRGRPHDEISARLTDFGQSAGPQVGVMTWRSGAGDESMGHRYMGAEEALFLALVIEMLAGATAAQHRDLAKGLRLSAESLAHESGEAAGGQ